MNLGRRLKAPLYVLPHWAYATGKHRRAAISKRDKLGRISP